MKAFRIVLAAGALAASAVQAQPYPNKPIRLVVGFAPGGNTDVVARVVGQKLGERLGQQVVIENKAGAGGTIATGEVARAAPDGYTLLFAADTVITLHLVAKVQFDMQRDFVPITLVTIQPIAVAVHPSLGVGSVQELIAYGKANPGKLSFAHSGTGTGQHFSGELRKKMAGLAMVHVPYRGGGPAVQDLVGGQVPMAVMGSTPLIPHHKAGRIKIIAFTTKERFAPMPEIPTLHEAGLTGFDTSQWLGLMAPRGTPAAVVARLHAETSKIVAHPEVKARLAQAALQTVGNTPQEFEAVIRADTERWTKLADELGIKPQ